MRAGKTNTAKDHKAGLSKRIAKKENNDNTPAFATASEESISSTFPIVGIGASAGGLAAFEAFFSGLAPETLPGMAFVLMQHLSPDHKSVLTEIISRYTTMKVIKVKDGMTVEVNCVYIIPPGYYMVIRGGVLQLLEPSVPRGKRLPIDFFFYSLAKDQRERAIAIILSGNGSDGAKGVRAIKSGGGMIMVQDPATADNDDMPRNVINTGVVDYSLPPAEMAPQLLAYFALALDHLKTTLAEDDKTQDGIQKLLIFLRDETGHDFRHFKYSTTLSRVRRRMAVCRIDTIDAYTSYLHLKPAEVEALLRDFLSGDTSFFKDEEAFENLEKKVIPKLFKGKPADGTIRAWLVGCGSGEEAYSVAILLEEHRSQLQQHNKLEIFATDIDKNVVAAARSVRFPTNIMDDISEERLSRYFSSEDDGGSYQINKNIRDAIVFSVHDVAKDPPFSKIDLIVCRNRSILVDISVQEKIIPLFHYALNPGGFLFLDSSVSTSNFNDLFLTADDSSKLFQRQDHSRGITQRSGERTLSANKIVGTIPRSTHQNKEGMGKISLRHLTEQLLLQQITSAAVLVKGEGDILYFHGNTGRYLEIDQEQGGVGNLLKMVHQGLQHDLEILLRKAEKTKRIVRRKNLLVENYEASFMVNLTILPVNDDSSIQNQTPLYLVTLEEVELSNIVDCRPETVEDFLVEKPSQATPVVDQGTVPIDCFEELKQQLMTKEEEHRSTSEDLEAINEELEAANEELQSFNEEMQSINEELQATNEELEASQEELATVNAELQNNVSALARANNDINNLLAGTGIATVFVDHSLCVLGFTPTAKHIINLIPGDIGRPIAQIATNLSGYDQLLADIQAVLDTLQSKEMEAQTEDGMWFMMRILPYRTLENVIEGAVITFVDITETKRAQEALRQSEERFRLLLETMPTFAVQGCDIDGTIHYWNKASESLYHYSAEEAINANRFDLLLPEERRGDVQQLITEGISSGQNIPGVELEMKRRDGSLVPVFSNHVLLQRDGADAELFSIDVDLTKQKQADEFRTRHQEQCHRIERAEGLERMAGAFAHLFNNKMQVVTGNLELAIETLAVDEPLRECIDSAMQAATSSSEVGSLMLTYIGQSRGTLECLDLSEIIRIKLSELETLLPPNILFKAELPESGPVVWTTENQIFQVLTRLVTNAQEAIGKSDGEVKVVLRSLSENEIPTGHVFPPNWLRTGDRFACLEVSDTGCGIITEEIDKIFDPFYSTKFTGRGLGLAVAMGLVRTWGAMICVQSEVGKGSRFMVFFPLIEDRVTRRIEKFVAPSTHLEVSGAVLVVDDDNVVRLTIETILKRLGFQVFTAENGSAAFDLILQHQEKIQCVITDLAMPGMNGWELLEALRKVRPQLPVVMASGYDESHVMSFEHNEQPHAFLQKPFSIQGLKDTLAKIQVTVPESSAVKESSRSSLPKEIKKGSH